MNHQVYRKLWPGESSLVTEHLLRLGSDDRHLRFGGAVSDEFIRSYGRGYSFLDSLAVGYFADGALRGVGEVFFGIDTLWFDPERTWQRHCESAISVESGFQGAGIGTELFRRIVLLARNRGMSTMAMLCLSHNARMQRIARKFAAEIRPLDYQVEGFIHLALPDFFTLLEESVDNGFALMRLPEASTANTRG